MFQHETNYTVSPFFDGISLARDDAPSRLLTNTGNRLEVLPPSLSQLTQLEVLTLSSNHIYQLPDEMVDLTKLKVGGPHKSCR